MQLPGLAIRLFGAGSIASGSPPAELRLPPNGLAVVAFLLLAGNAAIPRDEVAFALWPDDPEEDARANLRRTVYLLQRALPRTEAEWLISERRSISWNRDAPYWFDVREYERYVAEGNAASAVPLYAGDLMATTEGEWLNDRRERLRGLHLQSLGALVEHARASGDYARAIEYAKTALRCDPWREDFVRGLIELRSASGDRAGAVREYRTFAETLQREIGVEPMPETAAVLSMVRVRAGAVPHVSHVRKTRSHSIPPSISTFVGRVAELEEIGALFETARLVTLVGPAGVGKTRLGFEFARRSLERYRDGVRLIEIAPVTQEAFFLPTVASALGLADVENRDLHARIAEELADAHVLLVLDNCERMIAPCSEFAERVLTTAGEVTILATSRESLGVPGGVVYEVRPLRVPEPEETGGPQLIEYDAVRLLCQRVAAVYPQFRLTEQNASLIGDITRRLDGIPLAIELAASHARALSPGQILEHLDDRFALLKSTSPVAVPHQRTLRGTIDWSYERLVEDEARMLRSLAVFRGHFSLEAAISVSAENADATQALAVFERLVDKSFVTTVPRADDNRYGLLESIREYLLEKLADLNEERIAQRRHLEYFALLAERLESELTTNRQSHAMALLSQENDNLRAALEWSTEDSEVREWRLRLLGALRWYYWFRGLLAEGSAYCEQILRAAPAEASRAGARALSTYGLCTLQQGAVVEAGEALERALTMYARIGEERDAVITRIHAGIAALFCNDRAAAARYLESASAETESFADDLWLRAYARGGYGVYAAVCGDRRASIEALQDSVDLSERAGETFQGTFWRLNLAIARYDEDPEAAFELFAQCAERGLEQHNERIVAGCFEGFAWCLQHAGSAELAARFLGAEQALRKRTAQALLPQWQRSHDATVRAITGTLGTARLSREIETGVQWLREAPMDALCSAAVHDFSDRIRSQAARKKRAPPRA